MKDICNPKPIDFFGTTQWQCGCGKYFGKEQAKNMLTSSVTTQSEIIGEEN